MIPKKLETYLLSKSAKYYPVDHKKVFTAFDAAKTMKVELNEIAKNLLVKTKSDLAIVVVGADQNIDLAKLAKFLKIAKVDLPKEKVITEKLKVKPGNLSAFGGLYKIPVYIDNKFAGGREAIFSSGDLTTSIRMKVKEFVTLENAVIGTFGVKKAFKKGRAVKKPKQSAKGGQAKVTKVRNTKKGK
jgi:prolyl-tRNA editing enzyme YbaK/EbsC (Cys-tRNA(Pro) deacylase)